MNRQVKISSKHQIVIPKEAMEFLGVKSGDRLVVETSGGDKLFLWRPPKNYAEYMAGLHKEVWKETNIKNYLSALRKEWDKKKGKKK